MNVFKKFTKNSTMIYLLSYQWQNTRKGNGTDTEGQIQIHLKAASSATTPCVLALPFIQVCGGSSVNKTLTSTSPLCPENNTSLVTSREQFVSVPSI
jgi:hypothetical protein